MSGMTPEEAVESLEKHIKEAAAKGLRCIRAPREEFHWERGWYNREPLLQEAVKILQDLGYKVEEIYEERQFVDMGTLISW